MNKVLLITSLLTICIACDQKSKTATNKVEAELVYKTNAKLGEGAFWNHKSATFWWVDILSRELHIFDPATKTGKSYELSSLVGTVVPTSDDRAMVALQDGIYILDLATKELTLFSDIESNRPDNRFNDGKCDPMGRLWVGSMNLSQDTASAHLYMINKDSSATKKLDHITISNGIVWTKDSKTMYYIDTPTGHIRAYDYDNDSGNISNERIAVTVSDTLGFPDGMAIDSEDKLWVGLWNGNGIARFDPLDGSVMSYIPVPAHNVTACAFGGPNLDTLYITTANVDMTPEEIKKYPDAGSLFKVAPGVTGVKSTFFEMQ